MSWSNINIWVKAFLIALIIPLVIYGHFAVYAGNRALHGNTFDCSENVSGPFPPEPCSMLKYLVKGFDASIVMLGSLLAFVLSLIVTQYTALILVLKKKKNKHWKTALVIGIALLIAITLIYIYLSAKW